MKPSLHWEAYKEVGSILRFMESNSKLIEFLGTNKRTDLDTIKKAFAKAYNGGLEIVLEMLRKDGILLERYLPGEDKGRVDDMMRFYSVNWQMIKAINKAIDKL